MNIVTALPCDLPLINFGTLNKSIHSCRSCASKFDSEEINKCSQHSVSRYCKFLACIGSDSDDDDDDDDEEFSEHCVEFLNWIDTQNVPTGSSSIQDCSNTLTRPNGLKPWHKNSFEESQKKSPRLLFSYYEPSLKSIKAAQELRKQKQWKVKLSLKEKPVYKSETTQARFS